MATTDENRGYTLALLSRKTGAVVQKLYLKPMALYVPSVSFDAVTTLVDCLGETDDDISCEAGYALSMTNNNNGVSVDRDFESLAALADKETVADTIKDLINIIRGYDDDDENNVCGW